MIGKRIIFRYGAEERQEGIILDKILVGSRNGYAINAYLIATKNTLLYKGIKTNVMPIDPQDIVELVPSKARPYIPD